MDGEIELLGDGQGTDIRAVEDGFVSLTPIWFDLTHQAVLGDFQKTWEES